MAGISAKKGKLKHKERSFQEKAKKENSGHLGKEDSKGEFINRRRAAWKDKDSFDLQWTKYSHRLAVKSTRD